MNHLYMPSIDPSTGLPFSTEEDLELKDLPTVFIYGVDNSILYIEREIVNPIKQVISGEKVSPSIPKSGVFPSKVEHILSTPYYQLSSEDKKELVKSSWWIWLIILAVVLFVIYKYKIIRW